MQESVQSHDPIPLSAQQPALPPVIKHWVCASEVPPTETKFKAAENGVINVESERNASHSQACIMG